MPLNAPAPAVGVDSRNRAATLSIAPGTLGSAAFRKDYGLRYAYLAGAMYKGIASKELVVALGKAGLMGYLGTGGMKSEEIEAQIRYIQRELAAGQSYGVNLLSNLEVPEMEMRAVECYLRCGVTRVEAAAYMQASPALVRFRLAGLRRTAAGSIEARHWVMAKVSRPEVAEVFMRPAPAHIVAELRQRNLISAEQAELAAHVPMAQEVCVEADSGGHTDQGNAYVLLPAIRRLRDRIAAEQGYTMDLRVGAAGGIGTAEAALAAFMLGADFVMTGSINQCTVEAGTSDAAKDLLQDINVQDTTYAPAGDMFELGAKVQVVKKGLFFPSRANKLYELYQRFDSLEQIDEKTRRQIQDKFFKRSFEDVWAETRAYYSAAHPQRLATVDQNPKQKMAMIFRWYFVHSARLAMRGTADQRVDYQIHCGPALGAFNQWVAGTPLQSWRNRHVAEIAELLMTETAQLATSRMSSMMEANLA